LDQELSRFNKQVEKQEEDIGGQGSLELEPRQNRKGSAGQQKRPEVRFH
jgi:hypothetical protein